MLGNRFKTFGFFLPASRVIFKGLVTESAALVLGGGGATTVGCSGCMSRFSGFLRASNFACSSAKSFWLCLCCSPVASIAFRCSSAVWAISACRFAAAAAARAWICWSLYCLIQLRGVIGMEPAHQFTNKSLPCPKSFGHQSVGILLGHDRIALGILQLSHHVDLVIGGLTLIHDTGHPGQRIGNRFPGLPDPLRRTRSRCPRWVCCR